MVFEWGNWTDDGGREGWMDRHGLVDELQSNYCSTIG